MNVSSTYLSHIDGFSDADPNAISSKYSIIPEEGRKTYRPEDISAETLWK